MAQFGPFVTSLGTKYWVRSRNTTPIQIFVGFDIDSDPLPDIWMRYTLFLETDIEYQDKYEITNKILELIPDAPISPLPPPVSATGGEAPTGVNNRSNPYYARENHVRLARSDSNRSEFFGSIGGVPNGPSIVTSPIISGEVLPNEVLTLTQVPVWDGTETSSSWVWTADGVEIAGSTDAVTITVPTSNIAARYRVVASATNVEGTSVANSNELLLEAPVLETPLVNQSFAENSQFWLMKRPNQVNQK